MYVLHFHFLLITVMQRLYKLFTLSCEITFKSAKWTFSLLNFFSYSDQVPPVRRLLSHHFYQRLLEPQQWISAHQWDHTVNIHVYLLHPVLCVIQVLYWQLNWCWKNKIVFLVRDMSVRSRTFHVNVINIAYKVFWIYFLLYLTEYSMNYVFYENFEATS